MRRRRRELARVRSDRAPRNRPNSEWGVHGDKTGNACERLRFLFRVCRILRCSMVVHVLRLLDSSMRHVKLHYCCGVCT